MNHFNGRHRILFLLFVSFSLLFIAGNSFAESGSPYFRITAIDKDTGRGVPLVKFTAIENIDYYTDSAGVIAFLEPGLMGENVYFKVSGDGYDIEKNDIDQHGLTLQVQSGGEAVVKLTRRYAAQRLYRITGLAPYRDSIILGDKPPTSNPLLNAKVVGQDSVYIEKQNGRLFRFWGDTIYPNTRPEWNFEVTAAYSDLPENGGLDPDIGINLDYFTDKDGYSKKMIAPEDGGALTWLDGLVKLKDGNGKDNLFVHYIQMRRVPKIDGVPVPGESSDLGWFWADDSLAEAVELARKKELGPEAVREYREKISNAEKMTTKLIRGLMRFDDKDEYFKKVTEFPEREITELHIGAQAFKAVDKGTEHIYYPGLFPNRRVKADINAISDINKYQAFTCLKTGESFNNTAAQLDRDSDGTLKYSWKENTSPIGPVEQQKLLEAGHIKPEERWIIFRDSDTGREIKTQHNTITWNPYRNRWVGLFTEEVDNEKGKSLGETWYAEADTPLGPWAYMKKVVTFDNYSFYNPCHTPYFDRENGRIIYFEGTYVHMFSASPAITPRYEYNQVMYKLELDDPRLYLPVPVYRLENLNNRYVTLNDIPDNYNGKRVLEFFAPDRQMEGTVPVYGMDTGKRYRFLLNLPGGIFHSQDKIRPAFYAEPYDSENQSPGTMPLYEYRNLDTGAIKYGDEKEDYVSAWERSKFPIFNVWENPSIIDILR